jgi:GNAT superfamily N-acetyltransferase
MLNRFAAEREFLHDHPGMVLDESAGAAIPIEQARPKVDYQIEAYRSAIEEMRLLFPLYWEELGDKTLPLEPNYQSYAILADLGALHLVTARSDGVLVGFHLSIIQPSLHYKSVLTCYTDIFYLKPEYRRGMNGYKMLKFACDSVRLLGVRKMMMGARSLDLGPVMIRLGFKVAEQIYEKVLP